VTPRIQSSSAVLASIRERLASAGARKPEEILDAIITLLAEGRGYAWAGIYLAVENRGVWQAESGRGGRAATSAGGDPSMSLQELEGEIAAPIRLGARTLGLIVLETGRASGSARQERVLVQQTARLIAQYLTTDRAKQLLRKTREKAHEAAAVHPHKTPQSARPVVHRAAAGERH
jgi:hypothetical protein